MVSQILFGETFSILETNKQWFRIQTHGDEYSGWIDSKQARILSLQQLSMLQGAPDALLTDLSAEAFSNSRSIMLLPGSTFPHYEKGRFLIGDEEFTTNADVSQPVGSNLYDRIPWYALKFAETPYLWGGRSLFGMDCSGFVQVVFKLAGIRLRRDTWQQSEQGVLIPLVDQSEPGDLAFFHNEEGRITHTGIILENQKIIHASGKVRIDTIDHFGIYNEETKHYSHHLRLIKRVIQ